MADLKVYDMQLRRLKKMAIAFLVSGALLCTIAKTRVGGWIASGIFPQDHLYTSISAMAEEHFALTHFATAVSKGDASGRCGDKNREFPPSLIFTPVPTLTEYVFSDDGSLCVIVYEKINSDVKKDTYIEEVRKNLFLSSFGVMPTEEKMVKTHSVKLNLDLAEINSFTDPNSPKPTLKRAFIGIPRAFSYNQMKEGNAFIKARHTHFEDYLTLVRSNLKKTENIVRGALLWFGGMSFILIATLLRIALAQVYPKYCEDVTNAGLPAVKFRHFILSPAVSELTKRVAEARRAARLRKQQEALQKKRAMIRRVINDMPAVDQEVLLQTARKIKIERWCGHLLSLTPDFPPDQRERSEGVCSEARELLEKGDFDAAKEKICAAIDERKSLNVEQKV